MKALKEIYGLRFFARRYKLNWRAPIMYSSIMEVFNPSSVIDIGCATGDIVAEFNNNRISALGIEGSECALDFAETDNIITKDMRLSIDIDWFKYGIEQPFDLCMSLEVIEHIEQEYEDVFIDNLCKLSDRILLSAAPPGAGGHHHVNCQPVTYWLQKFIDRGYEYSPQEVVMLRQLWEPYKKKDGIRAFYNDILYFRRVADD